MANKKKDKKQQAFEESAAGALPLPAPVLPPDMSCYRYPGAESVPLRPTQAEAASAQEKKTKTPRQQKHHYDGHRERMRQRFLESGGAHMPDYEFLEMLLFRSRPRIDTKPLAKALLARFGTLAEVLSADKRRLEEVEGCGETVAVDLKIVGAAAARMLRSELLQRNVFSSWDKLIAYCRSLMAHEKREQFRVLFLDKKNGLITDKIMHTGTVDHTAVYPREVVSQALELGASAVVLVHNHPSGDPTPSRLDIAMTTKLRETAEGMNIAVHDHLIIGRNGYTSLREKKLL